MPEARMRPCTICPPVLPADPRVGGSSRKGYCCTATVTPAWLLFCPIVTTTGTALPPVISDGTRACTWRTPAIIPVADPAYNTSAGRPPIVTVTFCNGELSDD